MPSSVKHTGFVDYFNYFSIKKSYHFYNFWIQKFTGPFLWFLEQATEVFLMFLDPKIILIHFFGSRNYTISVINIQWLVLWWLAVRLVEQRTATCCKVRSFGWWSFLLTFIRHNKYWAFVLYIPGDPIKSIPIFEN